MLWKWATIIGLSMTPALLLGQSAAAAAGIAWHLDPRILIPVMALAGFAEGLIIAWLGGTTERIGFLHRWFNRLRKPKTIAFTKKWGRWGGMTLGVAVLGQEPILLALRVLGVDMRKLIVPTAVSNVIFSVVYYCMVRYGADHISF